MIDQIAVALAVAILIALLYLIRLLKPTKPKRRRRRRVSDLVTHEHGFFASNNIPQRDWDRGPCGMRRRDDYNEGEYEP